MTQNLAPRVLTFLAACPFGFCIFPAGTPILFQQTFAGTPTAYRYDWNGDGSFEQVSATPVPSHAYPAAGLAASGQPLALPRSLPQAARP